MGAFDWIGELVDWLVSLIPHLEICRANHAGVKFVKGKKPVIIKPGLFLYWPVVTEIELLPTARQTMNLESQTLTTKDDKIVTISAVVIYHIDDVVKAIVDTWDIEDTISDVALKANVEAITGRTFAQARKELTGKVEKDITQMCRRELKPFGIKVVKATLTDFAETDVIRLVGVPQSSGGGLFG